MTLIFSPVLLVIYPLILIIIYISDGFPGLYKQQRVGKNGKSFLLYKFRTMDALSSDDVHQEHYEKLSEKETIEPSLTPSKPIRIENDDRITNIGNFLRKTSLDELPNLINVLRGEMSIVGPRPLFDDDTSTFDTKYMRRLNVLPGITGLLQINDRNTDEFEIWYKYDLLYIEQWSLALDLKIMLLTPKALFTSKNKGL